MIKELIRLATHLDAKGLRREADYLDAVIKSAADPEEPHSQFSSDVPPAVRTVQPDVPPAKWEGLFPGARERRRGRDAAEGMDTPYSNHYIFTVQLHSPEDISTIDLDAAGNALADHIRKNVAMARAVEVGQSAPNLKKRR